MVFLIHCVINVISWHYMTLDRERGVLTKYKIDQLICAFDTYSNFSVIYHINLILQRKHVLADNASHCHPYSSGCTKWFILIFVMYPSIVELFLFDIASYPPCCNKFFMCLIIDVMMQFLPLVWLLIPT